MEIPVEKPRVRILLEFRRFCGSQLVQKVDGQPGLLHCVQGAGNVQEHVGLFPAGRSFQQLLHQILDEMELAEVDEGDDQVVDEHVRQSGVDQPADCVGRGEWLHQVAGIGEFNLKKFK